MAHHIEFGSLRQQRRRLAQHVCRQIECLGSVVGRLGMGAATGVGVFEDEHEIASGEWRSRGVAEWRIAVYCHSLLATKLLAG